MEVGRKKNEKETQKAKRTQMTTAGCLSMIADGNSFLRTPYCLLPTLRSPLISVMLIHSTYPR